MRQLFEPDHKPKWTLIVAGNDPQMLDDQAGLLASHEQELLDVDVVVVTLSPDDATVLHGDCRCVAESGEIFDAYKLSTERFSSALVDNQDCVKWAAPAPVSFDDLMLVIRTMAHHDAENATRGPASSIRKTGA